MSTPEINELWRFENIAYDVGVNFGNTSTQSLAKMGRFVNRAAQKITTEKNRRWSWLYTKDFITTVSDEGEYSLRQDAGQVLNFWIPGVVQKLGRIPTSKFIGLVPDEEADSGTPRMYDWRGVDSNGSKVVFLWPIPSADDLDVYYRFKRFITPIVNVQDNVRAKWGMPPNVIECVTELATALAFKGINDVRYKEQLAIAEAMIEDAYNDDQENPDTTYRMEPFDGGGSDDGPYLGSTFGE